MDCRVCRVSSTQCSDKCLFTRKLGNANTIVDLNGQHSCSKPRLDALVKLPLTQRVDTAQMTRTEPYKMTAALGRNNHAWIRVGRYTCLVSLDLSTRMSWVRHRDSR